MLQLGLKITAAGDPLQKITLERLYRGIATPKQSFKDTIEQLRLIRSIDERQYRELKKTLPYFVCGIFQPPVRRKEHFASAQYFILDIDHVEDAHQSVSNVFDQLKEVPEVMLIFRSPSGDGIKLLFRLKNPCTDQALFSAFYKIFARRFAEKYGLQEILDFKTSDVTRACFMSYDAGAYYNPDARAVDIEAFIPDLSFDQAEKDLKAAENFIKKNSGSSKKAPDNRLDDEILKKIKDKLHPSRRKKKEPTYYVPPQVDKAIGEIQDKLAEYELTLVETSPIDYGRKMKIAANGIWAEINIFYGKKGFSLVKTTKRGSNPQLADLGVQVLEQILSDITATEAD